MNGTPSAIGLDVAGKLLHPVVLAAKASGMGDVELGAMLLGMLCGVCANFDDFLETGVVLLHLEHCTAMVQEHEKAHAPMKGNVPMPGTVQ